jgi:hypothetical protein
MTSEHNPLTDGIGAARAATNLTIYRLVGTVFTFIAIEPHVLESYPEVVVDHSSDPAVIASALDAVAAAKPVVSHQNIDARVGLVFADAAGERLFSVYLGTFEWIGEIDGMRCTFEEPALSEWVDARYAAELPAQDA